MKTINKIFLTLLIIILVLLVITIAVQVRAADDPLWTKRQYALHDAAESLRAVGFTDDDPCIKALQDQWWQEYYNLQMVAKTISKEAGGCSWDHMVYVGAVIMNRVHSSKFPNTVYDVLTAPLQYSEAYTRDFDDIPERCYRAAIAAIDGDHDAPSDLYWQAEFPQGREVWKIFEVDTGYYRSTTYFCRGAYYE